MQVNATWLPAAVCGAPSAARRAPPLTCSQCRDRRLRTHKRALPAATLAHRWDSRISAPAPSSFWTFPFLPTGALTQQLRRLTLDGTNDETDLIYSPLLSAPPSSSRMCDVAGLEERLGFVAHSVHWVGHEGINTICMVQILG